MKFKTQLEVSESFKTLTYCVQSGLQCLMHNIDKGAIRLFYFWHWNQIVFTMWSSKGSKYFQLPSSDTQISFSLSTSGFVFSCAVGRCFFLFVIIACCSEKRRGFSFQKYLYCANNNSEGWFVCDLQWARCVLVGSRGCSDGEQQKEMREQSVNFRQAHAVISSATEGKHTHFFFGEEVTQLAIFSLLFPFSFTTPAHVTPNTSPFPPCWPGSSEPSQLKLARVVKNQCICHTEASFPWTFVLLFFFCGTFQEVIVSHQLEEMREMMCLISWTTRRSHICKVV